MPPQAWQLDGPRIAGLCAAALLALGGLWVLRAVHRGSQDLRVALPVLGPVGVPTCLVVGLCLLALAYHLLAYSLAPRIILWAVPIGRWWVVAGAAAAAIAASLALDRLESRDDG